MLEAESLLLPPVEAPELAPHAPHQQARGLLVCKEMSISRLWQFDDRLPVCKETSISRLWQFDDRLLVCKETTISRLWQFDDGQQPRLH
jgi:hypothetical protein